MLEFDKMLSGGNSVIKIVSTSGMLEAGGAGGTKGQESSDVVALSKI